MDFLVFATFLYCHWFFALLIFILFGKIPKFSSISVFWIHVLSQNNYPDVVIFFPSNISADSEMINEYKKDKYVFIDKIGIILSLIHSVDEGEPCGHPI